MIDSKYRAEVEETALFGLMSRAVREPSLVSDFFSEAPVTCFKTMPSAQLAHAIYECHTEKNGVDVYWIAKEIKATNHNAFARLGGAAGIAERFNAGMAFHDDVLNGAREVYDLDAKQHVLTAIAGNIEEGKKPNVSTYSFTELVNASILDSKARFASTDVQTWEEYFSALELKLSAEKPTIVSTGIEYLNRALGGGMENCEQVVIAGRPGMGKSAISLQVSTHVARHIGPAGYVSLEVPAEQLRNRQLSAELSVPYNLFRDGMTLRQKREIESAAYECGLTEIPFHILDTPRCTMSKIRKWARGIAGLRLLVVDYLQLISSEKQYGSREQEVSAMSREFKILARELNAPIMLLAQMNRDAEKMKREPIMSDLRESGGIENDADIVMFLHSPVDETGKRGVKAIIRKGRSSGQGCANLVFDGLYQRFYNDVDGMCNWSTGKKSTKFEKL